MSVKRYAAHTNIDDFKSDWHESKDGPMVRYEDYAALEARCAALAAENAVLKDEISNITFMRDDDFFGSTQRAQEVMGRLVNVKTPETDAFLAEVLAKGVEMFAASLKVAGGGEHPYSAVANEFAAQLRKGVQ